MSIYNNVSFEGRDKHLQTLLITSIAACLIERAVLLVLIFIAILFTFPLMFEYTINACT